jgi:hypothetical protein
MRIETLVVILEDIEFERKHLQIQQDRCLEWSQLKRVLDLINRGEYYLQELERCILKSLWRFLLMKSKRSIVAGNRYRLTFRDGRSKEHQFEVMASSMGAAVSENNDPSALVKIERIDPESGAVLGGFYNE